jgi:phage terminase large subunit-like protein
LVLAGRGFGKTRTGAEEARAASRRYRWLSFVAPTADDARDIMVEGESGVLAICPKHERPRYQPSKRRILWPSGARTTIFTADEPERLRGKQHQWVWAEELAAWRYPEAWEQVLFGLRLPPDPRSVITTTPKPVRTVRALMKNPDCVVTRGTSYENVANLAPAWFQEVIAPLEGTRLGRQELQAELLDDVPGALSTRAMFDATRTPPPPEGERLRVAVGMDPANNDGQDGGAEMGIVVVCKGMDGHGYTLADRSCRLSPRDTALRAIAAYREFNADVIVVEGNNGGAWVKAMLNAEDPRIPVDVVTASRGKRTRAEPVALLLERGIHHHAFVDDPRMGNLGLEFPYEQLEDQWCTWVPDSGDDSPDRLDAEVWAVTWLDIDGRARVRKPRVLADDDRERRRPVMADAASKFRR